MSMLGGAGMFAVSMWNPVIGGWIDSAREQALAANANPEVAELAAGQATLANLTIFPFVLIFAFTALVIFMRKKNIQQVQTA